MSNRLRLSLSSILLLVLVNCDAEPDEPGTSDLDHIEPEVCEPPQDYYFPGCITPKDDQVLPAPGCYYQCEVLDRCPLGYECREAIIDLCVDLLCQGCGVEYLCMRPDQIIDTAQDQP